MIVWLQMQGGGGWGDREKAGGLRVSSILKYFPNHLVSLPKSLGHPLFIVFYVVNIATNVSWASPTLAQTGGGASCPRAAGVVPG